MIFIEQYRKYLLIAIILITGFVISKALTPFIGGLLGACTIYILVKSQMRNLIHKHKFKNSLAAITIIGEVILLFLIPFSFIVLLLIDKAGSLNIDPQTIITPIENFSIYIQEKTGYNILKIENVSGVIAQIPKIGQYLMSSISSFFINIIILLFVLYFMLTNSNNMEKYVYEILPFSEENKKEVLKESKQIVTSNALGIPLLGLIQGIIAMGGYYLFDVPSPVLFGLLTCIATVIPIIGTTIVWIPLTLYLAIMTAWGNAIGLLLYGSLIITQIDNLIRFILQKKMANIHPLVTIFGVMTGLPIFGFMGIIFGPLLLSMFLLCFNIFKKEYLNRDS